jgi:primosomal protein N' (replication factor Y)
MRDDITLTTIPVSADLGDARFTVARAGSVQEAWSLEGYAPQSPEDGAPFVEVLIDSLTLANPKPYTYAVPFGWRGKLLPGMAVLVPFGPRRGVAGYITGLTWEVPDDHKVRDLEDVVMGDVIPPALQKLLLWMADFYLAPVGNVLQTAMPRGTLSRVQRSVALAVSESAFRSLHAGWTGPMAQLGALLLDSGGSAPLARLQTSMRKSGMVLAQWRQMGLVRMHTRFLPPDRRTKTALHAELTNGAFEPLTQRQSEIVETLAALGGRAPLAELARRANANPETIKRLAARGAISIKVLDVRRSAKGVVTDLAAPQLTVHQTEVVAKIEAALGTGASFLLRGVTGSGKTEVYLQSIARVLEKGQGAIVLVPEISLTPQTVRRFQARFGDTVAVLHSHLGDGERFDEWQRIRSGDARVVVGARSAIFAPVADLGLIVIDEEHESSYKQDKAPRYHARTVAEERARLEGACLILGSATPCLESFAHARDGRYTLLEMPNRVANRPMPPVEIVDMCVELKAGNRTPFSRSLRKHLTDALGRGEQAILLMNRRGYSSFVFCRECGYVCRCERCSVSMTFHQSPAGLHCHYCDARAAVPEACPTCHSASIRHFGAGTQQIEESARKLFPDARIVRVDRDTTSRKGSHQLMLDAFGNGEFDILIGTQMVAKGLDFPRVTVVGVMAADGALHLPDFRASERTFQLLTQVAGRAGRGELTSEVVVQTYSPRHPAIEAARTHDFLTFAETELAERQELGYPPFLHVANVIVAGPDAKRTLAVAQHFADQAAAPGLQLFGPHEAPLAILRGLHRYQIFIKAEDLSLARLQLRQAMASSQQPGVKIGVDLDPYNLL